MTSTTNTTETLWELIKDIRFGMLTHRHADGSLHSHPLTTQNKTLDDGPVLYFFVSRRTELGQRLQQDGNVNVAYAHPGKDTYVSISGQALVSEDSIKKEQLFSSIAKAWFPGGPTDPDLELVEVRVAHAEYWDVQESKVVQLFKMAKAAASGQPPQNLGEHKELHFS